MNDDDGIGEEFVDIERPRTRDAKGRVLPGVVLNPRGRPPVIRDIKDAARSHTRAALATLVNIMDDTTAPPAARISAAVAILDRGHGNGLLRQPTGEGLYAVHGRFALRVSRSESYHERELQGA